MFRLIAKQMAAVFAVAFLALMTPLSAKAAPNTLGISVQVVRATDISHSNLANNNNLWFRIEPGKKGTRELSIKSASDIDQRIDMSIAARKSVNGEMKLDPETESPVNKWASFSQQHFILRAHDTQSVMLTLAVPQEAHIDVYQPALLIRASAAVADSAQYKVPNALQYTQGMFVGVGTMNQIPTSFSINNVYGVTTSTGHQLVLDLQNTGKTPLQLTGSLQLSSATFNGPTLGPYNFYTDSIQPGETGHAYIPVGPEVTEDKWKIFADVSQANIEEIKTFITVISFNNGASASPLLISLAVLLVSILLAHWSVSTLRKIRRKKELERLAAKELEAQRQAERELIAKLQAQVSKLTKNPRTPRKVKTKE